MNLLISMLTDVLMWYTVLQKFQVITKYIPDVEISSMSIKLTLTEFDKYCKTNNLQTRHCFVNNQLAKILFKMG